MALYDTGLFETGQLPATFGAALRYLRQRAGLTQAQLGDLAGIDQSNISDIERGEILRPTADTLGRIAAALQARGVRVDGPALERLAGSFAPDGGAPGGVWASLARRAAALPDDLASQFLIAASALLTALEIASRRE